MEQSRLKCLHMMCTYMTDLCMLYLAELTTFKNAAAAHFNLAQEQSSLSPCVPLSTV